MWQNFVNSYQIYRKDKETMSDDLAKRSVAGDTRNLNRK